MDHKIKSGGQISMNIVYEKQKLNPRMRVRQQLKAKVIYINTKNWSPKAIVNKKPSKMLHTHTQNWLAKAMVIIKLYTGFSVMFFNIKFSHKYLMNLFIKIVFYSIKQ
jgi:hypothetical protein